MLLLAYALRCEFTVTKTLKTTQVSVHSITDERSVDRAVNSHITYPAN
jgi:hypothetical protein